MIVGMLAACALGVDLVPLDVNGEARSYFEHVPEGLPAGAPVVLVLHGGGSRSATAGRTMNRFTGFGERADAGNYLAVYPNSLAGNWNDGRLGQGAEGVDDLAYFDALLDDLEARHRIDRARVGLVGISNGGFMTQRLLCQRAEDYVGGVTIVATMAEGLACEPAKPVDVAFLVGTDDPLVPYEGGVVAGDRGRAASAEDARDSWVQRLACPGDPVVEALPDTVPDDGSTAEAQRWEGCTAGSRVHFVRFDGGGHTWPGASQYLPKGLVGTVNRDVDATSWSEAFLRLP